MNICATSKNNQELCDQEFWMNKLTYDHLPIIENKDWGKYYQDISNARLNAKNMIKIIETYNKYKGAAIVRLWYKKHNDINNKKIHDLLEFTKSLPPIAIDFEYKKKKWTILLQPQEDSEKNITYDVLLNILIEEIYHEAHGKIIEFHDYDENELLYKNLIKKSKQNKPIPRAYLMAYELLMGL